MLDNQVPEETSPHLLLGAQDQRLGVEQDQHPCGSTETSCGNCQETETSVIRACLSLRQPLQNQPGILGVCDAMVSMDIKEWTSLSVPELQWSPAEKTGRSSLLNRPSCPHDDPIGEETELRWLSCVRNSSPRVLALFVFLIHFTATMFVLISHS